MHLGEFSQPKSSVTFDDQPQYYLRSAQRRDPARDPGSTIGGETQLSDLAGPFDMTQTAVSKHVRVLSDAGLVAVEKRGGTRHCHLHPVAIKEASDWLAAYEQFWKQRVSQLQDYFADGAA